MITDAQQAMARAHVDVDRSNAAALALAESYLMQILTAPVCSNVLSRSNSTCSEFLQISQRISRKW